MADSDNWRVRTKSPPSSNSFPPPNSKHASSSTRDNPGQRKGVSHWNDPTGTKAIEEGRRIYVGNMPYLAKRSDVEALFSAYSVDLIDISIDPFTGRNLSYCFVVLSTKEDADQAMESLNGRMFLGRPLKVRPGVPKGGERRTQESSREDFGDRRNLPPSFRNNRAAPLVFEGWERDDAGTHWQGVADQGRRLYVGGLPQLTNHRAVNDAVREVFKDYEIEAISKRITPNPPRRGNHYYVFVDFTSAEQADHAVKAINGKHALGTVLKAEHAKGNSRKIDERARWEGEAFENNMNTE